MKGGEGGPFTYCKKKTNLLIYQLTYKLTNQLPSTPTYPNALVALVVSLAVLSCSSSTSSNFNNSIVDCLAIQFLAIASTKLCELCELVFWIWVSLNNLCCFAATVVMAEAMAKTIRIAIKPLVAIVFWSEKPFTKPFSACLLFWLYLVSCDICSTAASLSVAGKWWNEWTN